EPPRTRGRGRAYAAVSRRGGPSRAGRSAHPSHLGSALSGNPRLQRALLPGAVLRQPLAPSRGATAEAAPPNRCRLPCRRHRAGAGRSRPGGVVRGGRGLTAPPPRDLHPALDGATRISVQIAGAGRSYAATVVGTDVAEDVAVIQLQGAAGLKVAPFGDSGKVLIGDRVVSLGNALGRAGPPSVSQGFVVGLG